MAETTLASKSEARLREAMVAKGLTAARWTGQASEQEAGECCHLRSGYLAVIWRVGVSGYELKGLGWHKFYLPDFEVFSPDFMQTIVRPFGDQNGRMLIMALAGTAMSCCSGKMKKKNCRPNAQLRALVLTLLMASVGGFEFAAP